MLESSVTACQVMRTPAADCRSVLMVGTDLDGKGGVRAVVRGYVDGGLFERYHCVYVASHRAGSTWAKVTTAVKAWFRVAFLLRQLETPLVHVQAASRGSFWRKFVVCLLSRAASRPYIFHLHGGGFSRFYDESGWLARRCIRSTLQNASLVIALSEQWREQLLRICPLAQVEVLPNAVALPDLQGLQRRAEQDSTLLFLGHVLPAKGVYDLVRAFALVAGKFPRAKLLLGGIGELHGVQELAAQLGIADRLSCPGWLGPGAKSAALASSHIFLLPSYAEGMPMALLEAMSWGLPVIATPVGGIPQVIDHDVNGLLVAVADIDGLANQIARLLADPALRERLGTHARARVESDFSLRDAMERLTAIYNRFGLEPRA
jgi:glycosyltransferase involved in cell wall biosynthesis